MNDKTSSNITGSRRSFACRIIKGPTSPNTSATLITNNCLSNYGYKLNENEYQVVHFVGYIKYDLSFNVHHKLIEYESSFNDHSKPRIKNFAQSTAALAQNAKNLENNGNSSQSYYLILFGQMKDQINSKVTEFISRLDTEGNFIFVEPA
jgi:hypothetical protein